MYSESILESLIQRIYEAAVNAAGWLGFLSLLAGTLDGAYPMFFFDDPGTREGRIGLCLGMGEKTMQAYRDYYAARNVWLRSSPHLLKPGIVRSSQMMCARRTFLASEWYADFCKPLDIAQGLGATILQAGEETANISVFTADHRRSYDEDDFALFRALLPHLRRGLEMQAHLAASQTQGQAFETLINALPTPVLLVAADCKVPFMNAAAERLIQASDGLVIEDGTLRALRTNDTESLRILVEAAARTSAGTDRQAGGVMRIYRPDREPLEVLVSPIPLRNDDWIASRPPVAAVFVSDRERVAVTQKSVLMRLHGLTPTEVKIAIALSRGLTGKEISRELDISYNTLKTHMRHIYAKTRTKHQGDLVRVLASGLRIAGSDESGTQS